jgi:hypothetical protein
LSAKISESRRRAFLKAVRETGNQTLSAERAKVSRSWVTLHRGRDPDFDAAVRAAVVEARERLLAEAEARRAEDAPGGTAPPERWRHLDGFQLAVRGTGGSRGPSGHKWVQVARARLKQWDVSTEDRFLQALGSTCNVKAACAEVGMTAASAYGHRRRWPGFGKRWDEALRIGFLRLEAELVRAGWNLPDAPDAAPRGPIAGMTVDLAIQLLRCHKAEQRARQRPRCGGSRWPEQSHQEVIESFVKRLAKSPVGREANGAGPE